MVVRTTSSEALNKDANLWTLLASTAERQPDTLAVRSGEAELSYAELASISVRLANSLRAKLSPSERVAILSRNRWEFVAASFAAAVAGVILVPWNTRLTLAEHREVLLRSGARLLWFDREFAEIAHALDVRAIELETAIANSGSPDPIDPAPVDEGTTAQIYFTSGTTGRPKGVVLTHGNIRHHAEMTIEALALSSRDVWGHIAPMFHLADAWAVFAITAVAGTHTFVREFSELEVLRTIERDRITISNLVPTMLNLIVAAPEQHDTSSLRAILSGGAPIAPEVVRSIVARFGCEYIQTYGMTETSPFLTMSLLDDELRALPIDEQLTYRAKTGRALPGVDLRVVDDAGRDVEPNEESVGEIIVRGPTVTPGYWNDQAATDEAFDDGWLRTGDLAVIDARGFVTIVNRKKDVILTGGENVYSTEVENRLFEHPAVLEAAVIGLADSKWGERVAAAIVLHEGMRIESDQLIAFCRTTLAGYKIPRELRFVEALPRTGSGKISKRTLRDEWPSA